MTVYELTIDPVHSTVEFAVTFAMNAVVKGRFLDFGGEISLDTAQPAGSSVTAWADAASLTTDHKPRDEHLLGADFLAADEHPRITFESDEVEVVEANHWRVHGSLTMRGQSRRVSFDTRYYGVVEDAWGTTRAGFVAETDIQRSDWGMTWNEEQETGGLVSDRVRLALFLSAREPDEADDEDGDAEDDAPGDAPTT